MRKILVVTNDFPPRAGGIETMIRNLLAHVDPALVVVHTSRQPGETGHDDLRHDQNLPFPVIRDRQRMLLPTPDLARRVQETARHHGADRVWFGASAPLGLLGDAVRRAGVTRTVATTHGHEVWWATVPGARQAMRAIGQRNDVLTYLTEYTRSRIAGALTPEAASAMQRLVPTVDASSFVPGLGRDEIRQRYGLGTAPVVVCISRLVPRKGQDRLIEALPAIRDRVPGARLLLVGTGPYRDDLESMVARLGLAEAVTLTGRVPLEELPMHLAAGDVFAMPCRTRHMGFDVEGLGIVFLEAAAAGLPVVAGVSGGAPDAVLDGESGFVVDGEDVAAITDRVVTLLTDRDLAARMGARGRAWVEDAWRTEDQAAKLLALLEG